MEAVKPTKKELQIAEFTKQIALFKKEHRRLNYEDFQATLAKFCGLSDKQMQSFQNKLSQLYDTYLEHDEYCELLFNHIKTCRKNRRDYLVKRLKIITNQAEIFNLINNNQL